MEPKRYQVVLYDNFCGTDEDMDCSTIAEARQRVRFQLSGPDPWEAAFIYDTELSRVVEAFNESPARHFAAWVDVTHCKQHWNYRPRPAEPKQYQTLTYRLPAKS